MRDRSHIMHDDSKAAAPGTRTPMVQERNSMDTIRYLSNEELSEIITKCEGAITDGSAEIEDYEAFVLCQKELARRTWA